MAQDRGGSPPAQNAVRFGARTDLAVDVTLSGAGFSAVVGIIRNASISGALVETALERGAHADVEVRVDPRLLAIFNDADNSWHIAAGSYRVVLGESSADVKLEATTQLRARTLPAGWKAD